jgi:hypothetical protein
MENDLADSKVKKMQKVVWMKKEGYSGPITARSV